jgi:two-component system LytT family response regulator
MSENINVVIIDDEENFINSLEILIRRNFQNINIIGYAKSVNEGVNLLKTLKPDLVFLDIDLHEGTGFDILEKIDDKSFQTIFITNLSEYSLKAFDFAALHYLIKPVKLDHLTEAISRFSKSTKIDNYDINLKLLKESLLNKPEKILLPSIDGLNIFNISDIIRCEANDNYSYIYFINNQRVLISKTLQSLNILLNDLDFARIHNKHLVNMKFVKKFFTQKKPYILLLDNSEIPVGLSYKVSFTERLKEFTRHL